MNTKVLLKIFSVLMIVFAISCGSTETESTTTKQSTSDTLKPDTSGRRPGAVIKPPPPEN